MTIHPFGPALLKTAKHRKLFDFPDASNLSNAIRIAHYGEHETLDQLNHGRYFVTLKGIKSWCRNDKKHFCYGYYVIASNMHSLELMIAGDYGNLVWCAGVALEKHLLANSIKYSVRKGPKQPIKFYG